MDNENRCQAHLAAEMRWVAGVLAALLFAAAPGNAGPAQPKAGEEYEISKSYATSEQGSDGSSGSSRGHDVLLERVVVIRDGGLELEYDLPKSATAQDRARAWQFPVRVFIPSGGQMQVLNTRDLEGRVENWLKAGGMTRADCGRWIFTWNAFRIECDPQTVIETIEALDLRSADLRDGAPYREANGRGPGTLAKKAVRSDGETFAVVMDIDPDAVRRERAEADVVVGGLMRKPVSLEAAFRERAKERVSGTITVTFEADRDGSVWRRTRVTRLETQEPDGRTESRTATETVERRLVSGTAVRR